MTYAASLSDDEKKKLADAGQGVSTSGVVNSFTSPGGVDAPAPEAKTPGTGYVNLQQYLDTNQGQGAALANTATAGATNTANAYLKNATDTQAAGKKALNETNAANASTGSTVKSGIQKDATANQGAAIDFLGKGYGGPQASAYTSGLASDLSGAKDAIAGSNDANQQQANLQAAYGKKGNYTQGYGLLDNFLMRGDKSGQEVLGNVANRGQELQSKYDTINTSLTDQEKQARDALETQKKDIRNTAVDQSGRIVTDLGNRAEALNSSADQSREGFAKAGVGDVLATDNKAKSDLAALAKIQNMTPEQYAATFNLGAEKANSSPSEGGNGFQTDALGMGALANKAGIGGGDQNNVIRTAGRIGDAVDEAKTMGSRPGELWDSLVNLQTGLSKDKLQEIYNAAIANPNADIRQLSNNIVRESLGSIDQAVSGYDKMMNNAPDSILKKAAQAGLTPARETLKAGSDVGREVYSNANELLDNTGKTGQKAFDDTKKAVNNAYKFVPRLKNIDTGKISAAKEAADKLAAEKTAAAKAKVEKAASDAKNAASKAADDAKNAAKKVSVPELKKKLKIKF